MKNLTIPLKRGLTAASASILMCTLAACQTAAPRDVSMAFTSTGAQAQKRALDTRWFDTDNEPLVLGAVVALLQDLGFKVEETDLSSGLVSATKSSSTYSIVRTSVTTQPLKTGGIKVRATFQEIYPGRDPRYYGAGNISTSQMYRTFFDKLSQSLFLEAQSL